jgi:hypothetical protein
MLDPDIDESEGINTNTLLHMRQCARHVYDENGEERRDDLLGDQGEQTGEEGEESLADASFEINHAFNDTFADFGQLQIEQVWILGKQVAHLKQGICVCTVTRVSETDIKRAKI